MGLHTPYRVTSNSRVTVDDLARLSASIHEAATEPDLWPATLQKIADTVHAREAAYMFWDESQRTTSFLVTSGRLYGPEACALYATHYGVLDRSRQLTCAQPVGRAYRDDEFISPKFVEQSEYYNDFLIPLGGRYCMAARVLDRRNMNAAIGFHRGVSDGTFGEDDLAILQSLAPFLQGAARFQQKLMELKFHGEMLEAAMDRLSYGLLLLSARGDILYLNRPASELLQSKQGLGVCRQRLVIQNASCMARFEVLIAGCTRKPRIGGGLQIYCGDDRPPLQVIVSPLRDDHILPQFARHAEVLVIVSDPACGPKMSRDIMVQLFGLTLAEARLALYLASGGTVEQAAEHFRIAMTTARSQLRQVFTKTDTRRQAELVRLVCRLDLIR